jgi:hypothetical protein
VKIRKSIKCLTCDQIATLRISVGHNSFQRHDFKCEGCEEPIGVGLHVDFKQAAAEVELCENCQKSDEEGDIVNLDPHFVMPESMTKEDMSFSWMSESNYIGSYNNDIEPILTMGNARPRQYVDIYERLGGLNRTNDIWAVVKKAWSLHNNRKNSLSEMVLRKYDAPGFTGRKNFGAVTVDFINRLTFPKRYSLTNSGLAELQEANKTYPLELRRFAKYYIETIKTDNMKRYFDTFSEFFDHYSEYDQSILYVKNMAPVPDGHVATSYGFDRTKMFYGNAYENYTSNIAVLACLQNVRSGRSFDQFNSMDLKKYITINKANRGNPFAQNEKLNPFLLCADSSLRNASHHQSMELIDKGRNIQYRSGGTGGLQKISYSNYLEKCNDIVLSMASLFLFEAELKHYYQPA